MSTVNISLPENQVSMVDKLISRYGYANRSEFFRSLLRLLLSKPEIVEQANRFPFEPPRIRSVKKIMTAMRKTGKYSKPFLRSLEQGLRNSDYFTD